MNQSSRPTVRVPKTKAEQALRALSKMRILDQDFKIKTEGDILALPLVRRLNSIEFQRLQSLGGTSLSEDKFERREKLPRTLKQALSGKIPPEHLAELPKSFDVVGDIAILELSPVLDPFERNLARAMMDVHPSIRVVLARSGPVSGAERIRPLRHVAGEDRTETVHREFGCRFKVDLSKVFFSPRLSTEHQRIARQVGDGEHVVDMFSGAGPFSIIIAKTVKNVRVDAIDSNPEAAELIRQNVVMNKVASKVQVHLGDVSQVVQTEIGHQATRAIMNHPSAAKQFVDVVCCALQSSGGVVHYYTFSGGDDAETGAGIELEQALKSSGHTLARVLRVHKVREVGPMKWQIAIDAEVIPKMQH